MGIGDILPQINGLYLSAKHTIIRVKKACVREKKYIEDVNISVVVVVLVSGYYPRAH